MEASFQNQETNNDEQPNLMQRFLKLITSKTSRSIGILSLLVFALTLLAVRFTPLKKLFIPSTAVQNFDAEQPEIMKLNEEIENLRAKSEANDIYIRNLQTILSGEAPLPDVDTTGGQFVPAVDLGKVDLRPSKDDLELRKEVEKEEMINFLDDEPPQTGELLFTPLKGILTAGYEPKENHYAVDIAAQQGEAIKSVASGSVVFSDWTADTGYVVIIQHAGGMISVYKHALTVYKKAGEIVKSGEVIAAVGNTGELTTGPHLHFELWMDGNPVNPKQYIVF